MDHLQWLLSRQPTTPVPTVPAVSPLPEHDTSEHRGVPSAAAQSAAQKSTQLPTSLKTQARELLEQLVQLQAAERRLAAPQTASVPVRMPPYLPAEAKMPSAPLPLMAADAAGPTIPQIPQIPQTPETAMTAEDISRFFQRDARRYG